MDAARTHMISSAVRGDKGKIIFLVEDGSSVAKDDILIRLDPTPFETEIHRLGGEVRSLEAACRIGPADAQMGRKSDTTANPDGKI